MSTINPVTDSIRIVRHRTEASVWWLHIAIGFTVYYIHFAVWEARMFVRDTRPVDRIALVASVALIVAAIIGTVTL